jgi:hypothetical protein
MDLLCSDKTGTITQNQLSIAALHPSPPFSEHDLLRFAAYASDEAGQDPIDLAVLSRAKTEGALSAPPQRVKLVPFAPATKLAEATVIQDGKKTLRPEGGTSGNRDPRWPYCRCGHRCRATVGRGLSRAGRCGRTGRRDSSGWTAGAPGSAARGLQISGGKPETIRRARRDGYRRRGRNGSGSSSTGRDCGACVFRAGTARERQSITRLRNFRGCLS